MNENKILALIVTFIGFFTVGYIIGDIQATNYCEEGLLKIICPETSDYLSYRHKQFEEVLEFAKSKGFNKARNVSNGQK